MKKDNLTYSIIGCAMKVHNTIGAGFQELIYQRCLAIELNNENIKHVREKDHIIYYDGQEVGVRRADFVVEGSVIIELKALARLENVHLAQAKNYVVAYNFPLGLLINFGARSLEYKLIFHPNFSTAK